MAESCILLIEDNADDEFLACRIIRKVCSDRIIVVRDGEEAGELLHRMAADASYRQIRLVLLDLKLPKMNGIAVLQLIRGSALLRGLPVAVLTSSDNDIDQDTCRELGVLDYVFKPMTADRLRLVLSRREDP